MDAEVIALQQWFTRGNESFCCFWSSLTDKVAILKKKIDADGVDRAHIRAKDNEKAERMAPMSHRGYYILQPSFPHQSSVIVPEFIHVRNPVKSLLG